MADQAQDSGNGGGGGSGSQASQYIYFYYVTASRDGKHPYIEACAHKRGAGSLEEEIAALIDKAQGGRMEPSGWAMGDLRWRHRSHIVVALDATDHELHGVTFSDIGDVDHTKTFIHGTTGEVRGLPVWHCLNTHEKKNGTQWGETDKEEFNVHLEVHSREKGILGHNDTGTNTGPP